MSWFTHRLGRGKFFRWPRQVREVHRSCINSESLGTSLRKGGVSTLATQTTHYYREIPQPYHTAVLFDSPKWVSLMTPWMRGTVSQNITVLKFSFVHCGAKTQRPSIVLSDLIVCIDPINYKPWSIMQGHFLGGFPYQRFTDQIWGGILNVIWPPFLSAVGSLIKLLPTVLDPPCCY